MKETGLIFSQPMVIATNEGLKHVTRRLRGLEHLNENPDSWAVCRPLDWLENVKGGGVQEFPGRTGASWIALKDNLGITDGGYYVFSCPFGEVGDRIWMRETWSEEKDVHGIGTIHSYFYKAGSEMRDADTLQVLDDFGVAYDRLKWKPSIHMPRVACRTILELVSIGLERLQEITEESAESEGVYWYGSPSPGVNSFRNYLVPESEDIGVLSATYSFETLWCSLHSEDSWLHNPWVWVLKFKKV